MDTLSFYSLAGRTRGFAVKFPWEVARNWLHRQRLVFHDAAGDACDVFCPLPWDLKNSTAQVALEKMAARWLWPNMGVLLLSKTKERKDFFPITCIYISRNVDRPSAGVR